MKLNEVLGPDFGLSSAEKRKRAVEKYGRKNVASVTARQIGGDDGYHWNVLIDGRPMVNGLTKREVPHYKTKAYEMLLKKNGKV